MKHTVQALVIMPAVFLSAGCATDPLQSDAMTVAKAADINEGLRDVPAGAMATHGSITHEALAGADLANVGFSSVSPALGLTSLAGGAFSLVTLMQSHAPISGAPFAFVWRPPEAGVSDHDVMLRYGGLISHAIFDAVQHWSPELQAKPVEYSDYHDFASSSSYWRIQMSDSECSQPDVNCDVKLSFSNGSDGLRQLPARLAGFEGRQITLRFALELPLFDRRPFPPKHVAHSAIVDALIEASSKLPPTVWIYCPAFGAGYRRKDGTIGNLPAPIVIHQGTVLTFTLPSAPVAMQP